MGRAVLKHLLAKAWFADAYKNMLGTERKRGVLGVYKRLGFHRKTFTAS